MAQYLKNKMTVLSIGAYVLFFCGGSQGPVLCVGMDGHVGLKAVLLGTCSKTSSATKRTENVSEDAFQPVDSTCGPCVDIPLFAHNSGIPTTRSVGNGAQEQYPAVAHVWLTSIVGPSWTAHSTPFPFAIGPSQPGFPAIQTIVLLI
ncbi:MAG: hypothetical protein WC975_09000 [Phycisphaerae bacterium]